MMLQRRGEHFERVGIRWIAQEPWTEMSIRYGDESTLCDRNLLPLDETLELQVKKQLQATDFWWRRAFHCIRMNTERYTI